MTVPAPFRPRSVTELVDASVQLLRADYLQYVMLMAIAYMPWLFVLLLVGRLGTVDAALGLGAVGFFLAAMVWFTIVDGVMTVAASERYLGREVDVIGALRQAFSRAGALVYASIMKWLAVGIGLIVLIVPGAYFLARFFAASQVVMLEGLGGSAALARSTALSEGLKGHILKTLLLVIVIYFGLEIGWAIVLGMLFGGQATEGVMLIGQQLLSVIFTVLIYPFLSIAQTVLYYDVRIRREGYDLELMARDLDGTKSAQPAY